MLRFVYWTSAAALCYTEGAEGEGGVDVELKHPTVLTKSQASISYKVAAA